MDKCKNEETPRGDLPTTQHHAENMAISEPEKEPPLDHAYLGDEKESRQGNSSRRSAHGFFGTQIDATSFVWNGNATGSTQQQGGTKVHLISGGSVENNSVLFNGDLDPESFKEMFCKDR